MFKKFTILEIQEGVRSEVLKSIKENASVFADYKFAPPTASEKSRMGFSTTGFGEEEYVSDVDGNLLLCITTQSKSLNPNKVASIREDKRQKYMAEENKDSVPKAKDKEFKEEAETLVLATTFPLKEKHHNVVIRKDGKVFVEGTGKGMEDLVALIRKALGSFPALPFTPEGDVLSMLKEWIQKDVNDKIALGEKAVLFAADGTEYKVKGDLANNVKVHSILKDELAVATEVTVNYDGIVDVTINESLVFSGIKFDKELTADSEDDTVTKFILLDEVNKMVDNVIGRLV